MKVTTKADQPRRMIAGYVNAAGVTWLDHETDDREHPTAETVVCVAAAEKWIVAACVAILTRQGDLDPGLPVRTLLPELPAWATPIRVHHLIHHISGLPEKAVREVDDPGVMHEGTNESVLAVLSSAAEPDSEPGTVFAYSDIGYACLTALAERACGRPIAQIAQKHLFTPLGMTSTRFWTGPSLHPPTVAAHLPRYFGRPAPHTGYRLWSTARDMLRWAEVMQTGALGPRLTALLRQPGKLRCGTHVPYAWGSFIVPGADGPAFAHGGWRRGCSTYVIASPATARSAIVLAFTDDPKPAEALARQLARVGAA